jgi:EAL domain-containing protein (putative c-di-GMP-specific phosphodiesterase class I)
VKGGAHIQIFDPKLHKKAIRHLRKETDLRKGLDNNEFELHYQPLVNIHNGDVVGVEALARWQHPERGMISPAEFIPVAEESGLMVPLGQALIKAACTQAAAWVEAGHKDLRMSVNISPRQFLNDDIYALLERVLAETGLPPRNLEVEVTESLLLDDSSEADKTLQRVKEMGVGIAVDDFGTGYSSLSYLHAFPIDTLKIDRSFVSNGSNGGQARAILNAIVAMGKSLELKILAEGIETEGQRELLSGLGCHEAQGYHFSRPMPADEVVGLF